MNPSEYMQGALETESKDFSIIKERLSNTNIIRLLHAALGLSTEAGEFQDAIKKYIYYGKPLDYANLREELSDTFWYCALALNVLGSSFEEVMQMNHDKLFARYKKGFTSEEAINRDLETERKILERNNDKSR